MKLEKRDPLRLPPEPTPEPADMLAAPPDNDLELPIVETAPAEPLGPLARTARDMEPTPAPAALARRPVKMTRAAPDFGGALYLVALLASFLWAGLAVYGVYYLWPGGVAGLRPEQAAAFAVFVAVPTTFFWIAAYCVRQGARLAAEATRARGMAQDLLGPAAVALAETGEAVEGVRLEIEAAAAAADQARGQLLSLRQALATETAALTDAAAESARTALELSDSLGRERREMTTLAATLDTQATAVTEAIARQGQMVAEASDLAQTQIGEAEAALAARAADLATAAGDATEASRMASEDLARQTSRLETATIGISDQIHSMEDTLTQQRASLVQTVHAARADQEDFAVQVESQRAQLAEVLANAQLAVADLNEAAAAAAASLGELATTAVTQAQELAETAKAERDLLAAGALQSLGALAETSRFEREALQSGAEGSIEAIADATARERGAMEDAVRARILALAETAQSQREYLQIEAEQGLQAIGEAAAQAGRLAEGAQDAARAKIEALSEAAFNASQKAEAAFQARLDDAAGLIARSAELVDQAAGKTAERIEAASARAQATMAELQAAVAEFETRAAELPARAQVRAEELKATIASGFDGLLASARAAAQETQAIDAAFQDRVRRNYEMLSEAVRLMGVVSNRPGAPLPDLPGAVPRMPEPRRSEFRPSELDRPASAPTSPPPRAERPAAPPASPAPSTAESAGLRPRLRLSPTAADAKLTEVFEGGSEPASAAESDGWTWQELLSSMGETPVESRQLADRLIGEIEALGVDLGALLPATRVEELAAVLQAGDLAGAREVVRHVAPAAIRRLSRRTLTDRSLRSHAERFVRSFSEAVQSARGHEAAPAGVLDLLSTEEGRTYLLFDAALGDLA